MEARPTCNHLLRQEGASVALGISRLQTGSDKQAEGQLEMVGRKNGPVGLRLLLPTSGGGIAQWLRHHAANSRV